mmetsp:Transcript_19348/g.30693  ORF Transcript_19348/g.30693 Transcript_19348/m.30693 type:complete len:177 (-) Transcript_19348:134-664(-)
MLKTYHKTRHDALIHGKRYFRCPHNKGLFVCKQLITDVMDKKTAEQKTRVFKMGGTGHNVDRLNKKIKRKYNQQHPDKDKTEKPQTPRSAAVTKKKPKKKAVSKTESKPSAKKEETLKKQQSAQSQSKSLTKPNAKSTDDDNASTTACQQMPSSRHQQRNQLVYARTISQAIQRRD